MFLTAAVISYLVSVLMHYLIIVFPSVLPHFSFPVLAIVLYFSFTCHWHVSFVSNS